MVLETPQYLRLKQKSHMITIAINYVIDTLDEMYPIGDSISEWLDAREDFLAPYHKIQDEILSQLIPIIPDKDIELSKIPDYGDVYTVKEFKEMCESGGFTDSDGSASLLLDGKATDVGIRPSLVVFGVDLSRYSGVIWYNK